MATVHEVKTILRPGIQNIYVYYRYSSEALNWVTYLGGKLPSGTEIKFSVETYTNFTLSSWEAYYSDEYDDTINISLSPITGESSWTFTMPDADVYIKCEAEYQVSPSGYTITTVGQNLTVTAFDTSQISSRIEYIGTMSNMGLTDIPARLYNDMIEYYSTFMSDISSATLVFITYTEKFFNNTQRRDISFTINIVTATPPTLPYNIASNFNSVYPGGYIQYQNYIQSTDPSTATIGHYNRYVSSGDYRVWAECVIGTSPNFITEVYLSPLLLGPLPPSQPNSSIRYIMSPENSGEIDASAPSEFVQGTTEFTFKWRIKAAYEFRRLTPFAIGEGSLEDDVVYSAQYDGDNRTYTFTISSIPEWAIGVRVLIETIMTEDPSSSIGDNGSDGPVGGDGTFDDTSDEVPLPAIPEGVSAPDTGFVTLFRPTISQIKDLSNYMWSNLSEFIENLQKIFTNPMDYVISLASFPVTPDVGPDRNIYVGNFLTNIQMPPITRQFYEFNCGTVNISEYFGSFLDYAPNTRARIMLPFIGDADLAINEIMGKTLRLWYRIDLLSGACVAVLTIDNSVYYQWTGNCSIQIPVTASDFSRLYAGIARVGITAAAVAAGGAYLGALASAASGWNNTNAGWHGVIGDSGHGYSPSPNFGTQALPPSYGQLSTDFSADRGPQLNMSDYLSYTPPMQIPSKKSRALAAAAGGSFVGHNIMNAVPRVQHAGGMSGNIGIMGNRTPFIVLEYPNVSMPENYKHIFGYPSNMYKVLGTLAGYTKCKQVLFESTKTTDDEYEMVIEALKGGVYL